MINAALDIARGLTLSLGTYVALCYQAARKLSQSRTSSHSVIKVREGD